jgi:hypothetical protein
LLSRLLPRNAWAEDPRQILDRLGVPERLVHVRDYIWRGGQLSLRADDEAEPSNLCYELRADWPTPIFQPVDGSPGLHRVTDAMLDGRWVTGRTGYLLRVGIDARTPSTIYVRSTHPLASIPFGQRPLDQVTRALAADLSAYAESFLNHSLPVPQARAEAEASLARLGLSVSPPT